MDMAIVHRALSVRHVPQNTSLILQSSVRCSPVNSIFFGRASHTEDTPFVGLKSRNVIIEAAPRMWYRVAVVCPAFCGSSRRPAVSKVVLPHLPILKLYPFVQRWFHWYIPPALYIKV